MNRKHSEMDGALERRAVKNCERINKKGIAKGKYRNGESEITSWLFVREDGVYETICIKQDVVGSNG
jgi:hypothetical protein